MNFHDYKDQHNWINEEVYADIYFSDGRMTSTHQVTKTSTSYTLSQKILAQIFSQTILSCSKPTTSAFFSGISPIHIDFYVRKWCIGLLSIEVPLLMATDAIFLEEELMILPVSTYILNVTDFESEQSSSEKLVVLKTYSLKMNTQWIFLE